MPGRGEELRQLLFFPTKTVSKLCTLRSGFLLQERGQRVRALPYCPEEAGTAEMGNNEQEKGMQMNKKVTAVLRTLR